MAAEVRVLSLNVWGVRFIAKFIDQRLQALVEHFKDPKNEYDIVGLQEVWSKKDFEFLKVQLKQIFPHSYYFISGLIGSGCCIFSKHPIIAVYQSHYTLNGFPHKIQHGDWFGGKLIGLCKICFNDRIINVYNTHLHANYHHVVPKDIYLGHRVCQAYELIQFIESTSSAESTDLTILLGDLNLRETDLGFRMIRNVLRLNDSFYSRLNKDVFDETVGNHGLTCDVAGSPFVKVEQNQKPGDRIDYILFSSPRGNVKCREFYSTLGKIPGNKLSLHYSDHLAVFGRFSIEEKSVEVRRPSLLDEESRENLFEAQNLIEETIKRVEREQFQSFFCLICFVSLFFVLNEKLLLDRSFSMICLVILKDLFCLFFISICFWFGFLGKPMERNGLIAIRNSIEIRLATKN